MQWRHSFFRCNVHNVRWDCSVFLCFFSFLLVFISFSLLFFGVPLFSFGVPLFFFDCGSSSALRAQADVDDGAAAGNFRQGAVAWLARLSKLQLGRRRPEKKILLCGPRNCHDRQ